VRSHPARFLVAPGHEDLSAGEAWSRSWVATRLSRSRVRRARSSPAPIREARSGRCQAIHSQKTRQLFRAVNERIEAVSQGVSAGYSWMEFLCECDRPDCREHVNVTRSEYEPAHAVPNHFIVLPDPQDPRIEHVVAVANERFPRGRERRQSSSQSGRNRPERPDVAFGGRTRWRPSGELWGGPPLR
jgi:hypothetical protein